MDLPFEPPKKEGRFLDFNPVETHFRLLTSRKVREYICVVLSCQTPANLLQQQQKTNIGGEFSRHYEDAHNAGGS